MIASLIMIPALYLSVSARVQDQSESSKSNHAQRAIEDQPVTLKPGRVGVHYEVQLPAAGNDDVRDGKWRITTEGTVPPGLSVKNVIHGCVPQEPNCPQNDFDLIGTPTAQGSYAFAVVFSYAKHVMRRQYRLTIASAEGKASSATRAIPDAILNRDDEGGCHVQART
jgi:hypothetical protein